MNEVDNGSQRSAVNLLQNSARKQYARILGKLPVVRSCEQILDFSRLFFYFFGEIKPNELEFFETLEHKRVGSPGRSINISFHVQQLYLSNNANAMRCTLL